MRRLNLLHKIRVVAFSFFLVSTFVFSFAQTNYTIDPSDTVDAYADCVHSYAFKITIINQATDPLNLSWKIVSNTLPLCWSYSFCDWVSCHQQAIPDNGHPSAISVGGKRNLMLNIDSTNGYVGMGVVKVFLFDYANPTIGDTLTYIVNGCSSGNTCTIGINENNNYENTITIFPNPVIDFINIRINDLNPSCNFVEIYNIIGKKLIAAPMTNGKVTKIPLDELSKGLYFLKYQNKAGLSVTKKFYKI